MANEQIPGFAAALQCVRDRASRLACTGSEEVALLKAMGRVLAEDVVADRDFPAFRRSTRDGFAIKPWDAQEFRCVGEVRAGERWSGPPLAQGECVAMMTGAPVPESADAVIMLEHVMRVGDTVRLAEQRTVRPGGNIVLPGSEAVRGAVVVQAGGRMGPAQIGMAAACGCSRLKVKLRPSVAILATGDELVDLDAEPEGHQIRNSNSYALAAAVAQAGGEPVMLKAARDTVESLRDRLEQAFACDLVLIAGGVSAGKYDLAEKVLAERFGAEFFFTGVKMQPGRPLVFGRARGKYFFGLPGNPVSALVTFGLLARPLLAALCGESAYEATLVNARLDEDVEYPPGLRRFLPAVVTFSFDEARVRRVPWQGSGDMAALAASNGYLVVPEDGCTMRAGDSVTVWLD